MLNLVMSHQLVKANTLIDLLSVRFSPYNVVIGISLDTAHKTINKLFRPEVVVRRLVKPSHVMGCFH